MLPNPFQSKGSELNLKEDLALVCRLKWTFGLPVWPNLTRFSELENVWEFRRDEKKYCIIGVVEWKGSTVFLSRLLYIMILFSH